MANAAASSSEERLVAEATCRSRAAFAQLYDRHVPRIYRHVFYLVPDPREAEDLTAQTFLKAWEAIDRYYDRGVPFVAWLLRIAHNVAISHLRRKRDHARLQDGLEELLVDEGRGGNPEEVLQRSADEESVRRAVLGLRGQQRQVIILRYVDELDNGQIAQVIGKSSGAVRVLQHRALENLRRVLGREPPVRKQRTH